MLAILLAPAPPAVAANGTVQGTVTSNGVAGISEICVQLQSPTSPWTPMYPSATTGALGTYSIADVTPGQYKVYFSDCRAEGSKAWVAEFWYEKGSDWQTGDLLTVPDQPEGATVTANATLAPGHTIEGRVTSNGSTGLQDICASAFVSSTGYPAGGARTDVNGLYRIGPIPYGVYKVRFNDCSDNPVRISQWYPGESTMEGADPVDINGGNAFNVDATLSQTGYTFSGQVTSNGTTGIGGICVQVYLSGTQTPVGWGWRTDADGYYETEPYVAGIYKLQFQDCEPPNTWIQEWYDDQPNFGAATPVALPGDGQPKNAVLGTGYTISGRVTNGTTGIEGICVNVIPDAQMQPPVANTQTTSGGSFSVGPLVNGDYKLQIMDCRTQPSYLAEWWQDKSDHTQATPVPVSGSNVALPDDVVLSPGATISGRVTSNGTTGIQGICVNVQSSGTGWGFPSRWTQSDGSFRTEPVPAGSYKLQFRDCRPTPAYATEWFDNQLDQNNAYVFNLTTGNTPIATVTLAAGHLISGTVTDGTNPVSGVCVNVYNTTWPYPGQWQDSYWTQMDGTFKVAVPNGTYKVEFSDCSPPQTLMTEWWNDAGAYAGATTVTIMGSPAPPMSVALAAGHTISGTVSGGAGGIPQITVAAFDASGPGPVPGAPPNADRVSFTDQNGHYTLGPLADKDYRIVFVDMSPPNEWFSEWYENKADFATATRVDAGNDPTVDAVLERGYTISGTVSGEGAGTVSGICVGAFDSGDREGELVAGTMTGDGGAYTLGPFHTGTSYVVQVNDCRSTPEYIGEWWDDQPYGGTATPIPISGGNVNDVSPVLARGYTISGTVRNSSGTTLENICVNVADANVEEPWDSGGVGWAKTDSTGAYRTKPLPPGTYEIQFTDCNSSPQWVTEYWNNQTRAELAMHVPVTNANVTGINPVLARGYTISGTVTGAGTGGLPDICVNVVKATDESREVSGTGTGAGGVYTTAPLPAGSYKLSFEDCGSEPNWVTEWWNNQPGFGQATWITIGSSNLTGRNAELAEGNTISGQVTEEGTDKPLAGVCIDVFKYDDEGIYLGGGGTDETGNYRTDVLPAGQYKLGIGACDAPEEHVYEWYNDQPSFGAATTVDITYGDESGINAALARGYRIAGKVTPDGSTTGLSDVCVGIYRASDGQQVGGAQTGGDGMYMTAATLPGVYRVEFTDCRDPAVWASEWHLNAATFDTAADVDITAGHQTVNASLARLPVKPAVLPGFEVEDVTQTSAEIGGTVNPRGFATTYHFDYGLTSAYGLRAPQLDASAGSDASDHYVDQVLTGLSPGTTYHFRLVATNTAGTTAGADHAFTTAAAPQPPAGDTDPPQVAIACPAPVAAGTAASARWTANDAGSGLATAAAGDVILDTATAGTRTAVAPDARDNAGNVRTGVSCSYTVTPAAQPPAVPVVKIVTKAVRATRVGVVAVKVACSAAPCRGSLSLKAIVKRKTLRLGSKAFTIATGRTVAVKIRLSKANLATLKRVRKLTATATAKVTGGKTVTAKVAISRPR